MFFTTCAERETLYVTAFRVNTLKEWERPNSLWHKSGSCQGTQSAQIYGKCLWEGIRGKQAGWKHHLWLLSLTLRLCFAGGVWTAVRGRRESRGSDAPARRGRDSPCIQQQGQRPHGFCGQGPEGPCKQPSLAAPRLADVSSARPTARTAARVGRTRKSAALGGAGEQQDSMRKKKCWTGRFSDEAQRNKGRSCS